MEIFFLVLTLAIGSCSSKHLLTSQGCVEVKSVDHNHGPKHEGEYFNFYVADVNSILGTPLPESSTYMIDQFRNGQRIQEKQEVVLWNATNGGSIGDGHGRYNKNTLVAAPEQWDIGDYFCFDLVSTTAKPPTSLSTTRIVTTDISTSHTESTNNPTTEKIETTTAQTPYNCLDITVDLCRDETLDEIQKFPGIDSILDCQTICDVVYRDLCNSYIYYNSTKTCRILRDTYRSYIYECGQFGAGHDTVQNCLEDNTVYPDECKNMLESECVFNGAVKATINEVLEPEECFVASQIFNGGYYVHEVTTQTCTIYSNNKRTCNVHRGLSGVLKCSAEY